MRDYEAEKMFLHEISDLNYALLQRDWSSQNHGDLDIVLSCNSWISFVDRAISFAEMNNYNIIQAYEIEYGIVCIVMLTSNGSIHLDIAITSFRKEIYKLNLDSALSAREMISGYYVVSKTHEQTYKTNKRMYKHSTLQIWGMRLKNIKVLFDRLVSNLIFRRGLIIYIPYVKLIEILKCEEIGAHVASNLNNKLLRKYSQE